MKSLTLYLILAAAAAINGRPSDNIFVGTQGQGCYANLTGTAEPLGLVRICSGRRQNCDGVSMCHGVDIGGGRIITAAHCVDPYAPRKGNQYISTGFPFGFTIVRLRGGSGPLHVEGRNVKVYRSYSHALGDDGYYRFDFAMLSTGSTISSASIPLGPRRMPHKQDECYIAKETGQNEQCLQMTPMKRCPGLLPTSAVWCMTPEREPVVGDSGSPVYCKGAQGYYLMGVLSTKSRAAGFVTIAPTNHAASWLRN